MIIEKTTNNGVKISNKTFSFFLIIIKYPKIATGIKKIKFENNSL